MKLRTFALAGVALAALSAPAFGTEPGWYLGLAAGWDNLQPEKFKTVPPDPPGTNTAHLKDAGLYLLNGGYKWELDERSGIRTELEFGYTKHVPKGYVPFLGPQLIGGTENMSVMVNGLYDFEIFPR